MTLKMLAKQKDFMCLKTGATRCPNKVVLSILKVLYLAFLCVRCPFQRVKISLLENSFIDVGVPGSFIASNSNDLIGSLSQYS